MTLHYTTRPLSNPGLFDGKKGIPSPFSVGWSTALELLEREVRALKGRNLVLEMDISAAQIRLDGLPRASVRPETDRVLLAFESKHGPLLYASGRYSRSGSRQKMEGWQSNVYAIAKTLEALRAVDRYGAASHGEQYRGYLAIEAAPAPHEGDVAWLRTYTNSPVSSIEYERMIRIAHRKAHPDLGGLPEDFHRVTQIQAWLRERGLIT